MTENSYVIKANGAWLSEFKYDADSVTPIGSDVKQDAEIFEGLGEVIEALREIRLWNRITGVEVTEIIVEEAE